MYLQILILLVLSLQLLLNLGIFLWLASVSWRLFLEWYRGKGNGLSLALCALFGVWAADHIWWVETNVLFSMTVFEPSPERLINIFIHLLIFTGMFAAAVWTEFKLFGVDNA